MDKTFHLVVAPTTECNRKCGHCSFGASYNKERKFMKPEWMKKLISEARELGYRIYGSITGVGEPLMHPEIVDIAEAFNHEGTCFEMEITTSGFLKKDAEEKRRFQDLLDCSVASITTFCFSYHHYSPDFHERLENSLGLLLQHESSLSSEINIVCDRKNYFATVYELHEILACLAVKLGLDFVPKRYDERDPRYGQFINNFLEQDYSLAKETLLLGDSFMMPYIYTVEGKNREPKPLRMKPYITERIGSAKNLSIDRFMENPYRCDIMNISGEESFLYLNPAGEVMPAYRCMMSGLKLGTWETPLIELMNRKRVLENNLLRQMLADKTIKWGSFPCHECAALVKRNFSFD